MGNKETENEIEWQWPTAAHSVCQAIIVLHTSQDCTLKRNELGAIRTQTEREAREKKNLEDSVMEKMMQRLTMDKASQYTQKTIGSVKARAEDVVCTGRCFTVLGARSNG